MLQFLKGDLCSQNAISLKIRGYFPHHNPVANFDTVFVVSMEGIIGEIARSNYCRVLVSYIRLRVQTREMPNRSRRNFFAEISHCFAVD